MLKKKEFQKKFKKARIILLNHFLLRDGFIPVESRFCIFWDIFMCSVLLINIFFIPIKLAFFNFYMEETNIFIQLAEFFFFFMFIVDIFVINERCIYGNGRYVSQKCEILKMYIKNEFYLDIITLSPFLFYYFGLSNYIEVLSLLRILKIDTIFRRIYEQLFEFLHKHYYFLMLIKLFTGIIFFAHVFGCVFHLLGSYQLENGSKETWLIIHKLEKESFTTRYVNAVYFTVLTMTTVGYIETESILEKVVSIFISLILAGIFAYSINTIGLILTEMQKDGAELK